VYTQGKTQMGESIGVIGLGNMGGAISANLVQSGFTVLGYDIDPNAQSRAQASGVATASSVTDIAKEATTIIISLADPAAMHNVTAKISEVGSPDHIIIETGTLTLTDKEAAYKRVAAAGMTLLDCPISGTGHQARTRDLTIFASGDEASFKKCLPVFAGFSRDQKYCGPFGNGSRMKFVANHLIAIHNVAAAEAMVLGLKSNLDPKLVFEVISGSAATSRMFEVRAGLMAESNWDDIGATNRLFQKDLDVITNYAAEMECPVPLFSVASQPYRAAMSRGLSERDTAAVCLLMEETAGIDRKNWPADAENN
jgi:3-hydroxyisobutyrate dehydrogenase-like beta-hydroxyacid dehydrogenase